jgi:hypothetical protein
MSIATKRAFNASIFSNKNDKVQFNKSKDEKVKADYNGNGSDKDGMDKVQINGIRMTSAAGKAFIKVTFIDRTVDGTTTFYNGALFPNDRKESDGQPDFTGSLDFDRENNVKLRLAGWTKTTKNNEKYMSLAVSEYKNKDEAAADEANAAAPVPETVGGAPDLNDFPF